MKKLTAPSFFLIALLLCSVKRNLSGQTLECQLTLGPHLPYASIENTGNISSAKTYVSSKWAHAQAGLGLRVKIYRGFAFRAEANIRQYDTDIDAIGPMIFAYGTISHRKIAVAYLPEFRVGKVNTFFVSAGPVAFFELEGKAKIYSSNETRFADQGRMYGWQASAGIRCQLRNRLGILLEARYGKTFYQIEDPAFPRISYQMGNLLTGLAFNLSK